MDPQLKADIEAGLAGPDETERWDMACMLALHVEASPEEVWPLVARWGCSDELAGAVAVSTSAALRSRGSPAGPAAAATLCDAGN